MIHKFTFVEKILLSNDVIPHPMVDALTNILAGKALQVSVKLGLLQTLEGDSLTLEQLASKIKASPEGTEVLLDNLEALGYVKNTNGGFSLTKRGEKFFSRKSDSSMLNTILFSDYVFEALNNFEKNVQQGRPKDINLDIFTPEQWEIFNNTMVEVSRSNAKEIAGLLPKKTSHKRLIDIGGSHGLYSIEYLKKVSGMTATVFDLKPVEEFAKKFIKDAGFSKDVSFQVGDFFKDNLGSDYDVAFAFNIIHGLTPTQNESLFKKVHTSLNPEGMFVILDQIKEASGKSQLAKLVSSAQGLMLFNQAGGRTYTFEHVKNLMQDVGFKEISMKRLRAPGNALIIGYK